jgi:hypothetical protein
VARAQAVRDALITMGVAAERFLVMGYGDTRPIASNACSDGRSMNRRVDISVIPPMDDSIDPALRIGAAIRDLSQLPDSVGAVVRWMFTTTAEHAQRASIRFDLPPGLPAPAFGVTHETVVVPETDGAFVVDPFQRGEMIECRVAFMVASEDTQLIRDVRATLTLDDAVAPADSTTRTVTVQPRDSRTSIAMSDAATWTELVSAPTAGDTPPPVVVPPGDPEPTPHEGPAVILEPYDGYVAVNSDQVSVRARHPLGSRVTLIVGGDVIDEERVGQRTVDVAHQEETTTWYGVRLRGGWNDIVLHADLLRGGVVTDTVRVALATQPAEIVPLDARALIPADGRSTGLLRFAVRDGFGFPVMDGFVVTVVWAGRISCQSEPACDNETRFV